MGKRFEQTKKPHEIAPVFLKNKGRIEALFFSTSSVSLFKRRSIDEGQNSLKLRAVVLSKAGMPSGSFTRRPYALPVSPRNAKPPPLEPQGVTRFFLRSPTRFH